MNMEGRDAMTATLGRSAVRLRGFHRWLYRRRNDNTPIGDLVRDAISDAEYPWAGNAPEGLAHIRACGACFGAVAAMRQAIVEYRRSR